jgi:large subunit ribosomal protein L18e
MGIQFEKTKVKLKHKRTSTGSSNLYVDFLVKIYRQLCQTTISKFNEIILKRLIMSRKMQTRISLSQIVCYFREKKNKTIVVVGKVLNDERLIFLPKISLCALYVSSSARKRIIKAGGKIFTFDQIAMKFPTGRNCVLIRGSKTKKKKGY